MRDQIQTDIVLAL